MQKSIACPYFLQNFVNYKVAPIGVAFFYIDKLDNEEVFSNSSQEILYFKMKKETK